MTDKFQVAIFSSEGDRIETEAGLVILPGVNGHVGIMPDMIPYTTLLKSGCVYVVDDAGALKRRFFINKGKALMSENSLSISVDDKLKNVDNYSLEDAQAEKKEFEELIKETKEPSLVAEYKEKLEGIDLLLSLKKADNYSFK